jgi:hypothetical protein
MTVTHVDVGRAQRELIVVRREVRIQCGLFAVDRRILVLLQVEIGRHDSSHHVVDTGFGN